MVFPVIHSTLDPAALTEEIARRYDFAPPVKCQLISRANNDFYLVQTRAQRFALRVTKANFRTRAEYEFEAEYVAHLYEEGCRVPAPVRANDGSLLFEIEAPEGVRSLSLMQWLEGTPFTHQLTAADAHDMGAALAQLHLVGTTFSAPAQRVISTPKSLEQRIPDLLEMLDGQPEDQDFYQRAMHHVNDAYGRIGDDELPRGPVHGDYQFANVLRLDSGEIGMLDFDTCGVGYLVEDILTFVWRSDMEIRDDTVNGAFISGYESLRPLSSEERDALPLFRFARDLVMSSSYAILINRVGPVSGFDGDFSPMTELARRHAADVGFK